MKRAAVIAILALLAALNVYRAATQSFTIDEAFSSTNFTMRPLAEIAAAPYDASNHVLYTLLAHTSFLLFGSSELALRLPTLLAAFVFYIALYLLTRRLFGDTWMAPLAVGVLATQPLLQDHFTAARGYGLGIALWTTGLLLLTGTKRREPWAGIAFGAAIAANLMLLFPTIAIIAASTIAPISRRLTWPRLAATITGRAARVTIPAALIALALLTIPLSHGDRSRFYFGTDSLTTALTSVVNASVSSSLGIPSDVEYQYQWWFLAAALAASFAGTLLLKSKPARLICLATAGTFLLTVAAHKFAGIPYPLTRTALPLTVMILLSAAVLTHGLFPNRARIVPMAALALLAAMQAAAIRTSYLAEWDFDADTRTIAQQIAETPATRSNANTVCASWQQAPSLRYYFDRLQTNAAIETKTFDHRCTFRIVLPNDTTSPEPAGTQLFQGPRSGASLYTTNAPQ